MLYTDVKSVVVSRCDQLSPGCRAVELSRLRRGAVEALPVEPVELLSSSCRACRG